MPDTTELPTHPKAAEVARFCHEGGFPHCDSQILHAPADCPYCDNHRDAQLARIANNVAFTGHDPLPGQTQCPAEAFRGRKTINMWPGNRPEGYGFVEVAE